MDIQRRKDVMKKEKFNSDVGATAGCTLQLLLDRIHPEDQGIRHGIRADA